MQRNGSEIVAWLSGSALVSINVVTFLWAGKYLDGWPSVGKPSWYYNPPRSTQPFILSWSHDSGNMPG